MRRECHEQMSAIFWQLHIGCVLHFPWADSAWLRLAALICSTGCWSADVCEWRNQRKHYSERFACNKCVFLSERIQSGTGFEQKFKRLSTYHNSYEEFRRISLISGMVSILYACKSCVYLSSLLILLITGFNKWTIDAINLISFNKLLCIYFQYSKICFFPRQNKFQCISIEMHE